MRNKKRDPKWWVILALLNVLLIGYPAALYLQADDGASRVMALTLIGVGFFRHSECVHRRRNAS